MSGCRSSDRITTSDKKARKYITLVGKLGVIKRYEHIECTVDKANAMGILESTLRIIRKQTEKMK
jgi:hypothetical protein